MVRNQNLCIRNENKKKNGAKISVTKKDKTEANFDETLVLIGHILGNRHRPIQIEDEKIFFPILSESELDIFKKLFSKIIDQIELKIEERIFEPHGELKTHEH